METTAADAAYDWLTARHPAAPIAAVGGDGLIVPVPSGLDVAGRAVLKGRSCLDFVEAGDRVAVVGAWDRAKEDAASRVAVRLVDGGSANLHFFDLRNRYGTFVAVFGPAEDDHTGRGHLLDGSSDRTMVPPLVCRLRRDEVAQVVEMDDATTKLLGWGDEVLGTRSIELVHPDDVERAIANWMEMLAAPSLTHRWRGRYKCADGRWLWLDISNTNRLEDPHHGDVLTEMVDVSDELAMHEALREREQLLRRLTDALPSGVVQFDTQRRVLHANGRLATLVGEASLDALVDAVVDVARSQLEAALTALLRDGVDTDLDVHLRGDRVCRVALRALTDETGEVIGGLACVDDVTEPVRLRAQLERRATFDGLTGCYTRTAILAALDEAGTSDSGTGVVFVDLDRFKDVNDELGHAAGDELLAVVGERLRDGVRDDDLVGRLGGDEFLVLSPGSPDAESVVALSRRLANKVFEPVILCGAHPVSPRASFGTAWVPAGGDLRSLVADADAAMYAAKRGSL